MPSRVLPWLEVCASNSGALEKEYFSKCLGHRSPLRGTTSTLLASLSQKQKKMRSRPQAGSSLGGAPSKQKRRLKKAGFQSDVLVAVPPRDGSKETVVGPKVHYLFQLQSSEDEDGDRN